MLTGGARRGSTLRTFLAASAFGALRHPAFAAYTAAGFVSHVGTWTQKVGVGWLAWELTRSSAWVGAVAFADLFPAVLLGLVGGAVADRRDQRRLAVLTQAAALLQSLALLALALAGALTIWPLLGLTLLLGVVDGLHQPVRLALVPRLAPPGDIAKAVGLNSIAFNAARFAGPALAGVLLLSSGAGAVFAANALSFVPFLVTLAVVRLTALPPPASRAAGGAGSIARDVLAGLRYAAGHEVLAPALALLAITCGLLRPFTELLPALAAGVHRGDAGTLAAFTAAVGLGAMAGAFWASRGRDRAELARSALLATPLLAGSVLLLAAAGRVAVALPALAAAGFFAVAANVATQSLIHLAAEPRMHGRALGLFGLVFRGGTALGALLLGLAGERTGLPAAMAGAGLLALAAWLAMRGRLSALIPGGDPGPQPAAERAA